MPTTSLRDYKRYLEANLPEYSLRDELRIPPVGESVFLIKRDGVSIRGKANAAVSFQPVQPRTLEFAGKARFSQIKHYKEKRDKIIEYLVRDCPQKGLVLKKYSWWNKFTVGSPDTPEDDLEYEHLARLKSDTADDMTGIMFYARRFFGATTPSQKKRLIERYLAKNCRGYELVHFEHNNLFFIARTASPTGLGSGGVSPNNEGIFHFQSRGEWIDVQGIMLTSMSQLEAYKTVTSGPRLNAWNEHKISAEVKKYTAIMEEAGFGGRDSFQQLVAEVAADMQGGALHDVSKGLKEAIFGKHCRTHPVRATRMALSKIFGIVSAALPKAVTKLGSKAASAVVSTVISEAETVLEGASAATMVSEVAIGERAVPRWVQDIGLSKSDEEIHKGRWDEIQEHINSLDKWETRFIEIETEAATPGREQVVTCAQMNDLLRCYAKIQFHLDKLMECYQVEIRELGEVGRMVSATKAALSSFETTFKEGAVSFLNRERAGKMKTRTGAQNVFLTGGSAYKTYQITTDPSGEASLEAFLSNNAELRRGESLVDNDQAEIGIED